MPLRALVINGKSQNINLIGVWKKLIPTSINDFEGFKTSVQKVTADVVKIVRELGLELEPEDVTELLQSHEKKLEQMRSCFLWMSKESGFFFFF